MMLSKCVCSLSRLAVRRAGRSLAVRLAKLQPETGRVAELLWGDDKDLAGDLEVFGRMMIVDFLAGEFVSRMAATSLR